MAVLRWSQKDRLESTTAPGCARLAQLMGRRFSARGLLAAVGVETLQDRIAIRIHAPLG